MQNWKRMMCFLCLHIKLSSLAYVPLENIKLSSRNEIYLQSFTKPTITANKKEQSTIINEYTDKILDNLNEFIKTKKLEPLNLTELDSSFRLVIFPGWIKLERGTLNGISTFVRRGDVTVRYKFPNIKVQVPMGFSKLVFNYHYEVKFMGLGPRGTVSGKSDNSKFTINLELNMLTGKVKLSKFKINTLGSFSFKFSGNILTDWIVNIIVKVVMPILKPILNVIIQGFIVNGLKFLITLYNNIICVLLENCSTL